MPIDPVKLNKVREETEELWSEPVASLWSPQWAPNVVGLFAARNPGIDGGFEPQRYRCFCFTCNTEHRGECSTGAVRNHVCHFAAVHVHRDAMATRSKR